MNWRDIRARLKRAGKHPFPAPDPLEMWPILISVNGRIEVPRVEVAFIGGQASILILARGEP